MDKRISRLVADGAVRTRDDEQRSEGVRVQHARRRRPRSLFAVRHCEVCARVGVRVNTAPDVHACMCRCVCVPVCVSVRRHMRLCVAACVGRSTMQWARRRRRPEGVRSAAGTRGHAAGTQRVLTLRSHAVTAAGRFSMSRRHSARRRASRSSARAPSCRQSRRTYVRIFMNISADATESATVKKRRRAAAAPLSAADGRALEPAGAATRSPCRWVL